MNPLLALLLIVAGGQEEGRPPPRPVRTLIDVARAEEEREAKEREARARELLDDLGASSDPRLAFVEAKVRALAALGPAVAPVLRAAVESAASSGPHFHRARNAARALAWMDAPESVAALRALSENEEPTVRRLAAEAIGIAGDEALLPALVRLCEDEDETVVVEALRALGSFPRPDVERRLVAAAAQDDPKRAAAAIEALTRLGSADAAAVVARRFERERTRASPDASLLMACARFFAAHPTPQAFDLLAELASDGRALADLRVEAVRGLVAVALTEPSLAPEARETLRALLETRLGTLVRAAAEGLADLGDDSGVEVLVEPLDRLLTNNPRNLGARYQRAELLLSFGRYRDAYRDFMEGLRQEKDPRDPDRVYLGLARATAGMRRYGDAARYLRRLVSTDLATLPERYPEFRPMAEDGRYAELFERS